MSNDKKPIAGFIESIFVPGGRDSRVGTYSLRLVLIDDSGDQNYIFLTFVCAKWEKLKNKDGDDIWLAPHWSEYGKFKTACKNAGVTLIEDIDPTYKSDSVEFKIVDVITDPSLEGYYIDLDVKNGFYDIKTLSAVPPEGVERKVSKIKALLETHSKNTTTTEPKLKADILREENAKSKNPMSEEEIEAFIKENVTEGELLVEPTAVKEVILLTSNPDVSFAITYDTRESWKVQIIYKNETIFPKIRSKDDLMLYSQAREKAIAGILASNIKCTQKEAVELVRELSNEAGKHSTKLNELSAVKQRPVLEEKKEEKYPSDVTEQADDILKNGDPFKFFVDTWKRSYAILNGDDSIGAITLCVIASTQISNSKGLHEKIAGKSGFGKSFATTTMFNLFPPEKTIASSLSPKSLFYKEMRDGTVVYYDDIDLGKQGDIFTTIKQSTSDYQSETIHTTVVNGEAMDCVMAARVGWILSSVDNFDDEQLDSRFGETEVNDSVEMQKLINNMQKQWEFSKTKKLEPDHDTLVCRCMWEMLESQGLCEIRIPFVDAINWFNIDRPRSFPFFIDIIRAVTLFKIFQREKVNGFNVATIDDFNSAKNVYGKIEKNNMQKLTTKELHILEYLEKQYNGTTGMMVKRPDLVRYLGSNHGMKQANIIQIIHGKRGDGGLLNKVAGLQSEKLKDETDSCVYYWFSGKLSYSGIDSWIVETVTLDKNRVGDEIKKWYDANVQDSLNSK